jgi:hypothetical protein
MKSVTCTETHIKSLAVKTAFLNNLQSQYIACFTVTDQEPQCTWVFRVRVAMETGVAWGLQLHGAKER